MALTGYAGSILLTALAERFNPFDGEWRRRTPNTAVRRGTIPDYGCVCDREAVLRGRVVSRWYGGAGLLPESRPGILGFV